MAHFRDDYMKEICPVIDCTKNKTDLLLDLLQ